MKITKERLRQVIKEELEAVFEEEDYTASRYDLKVGENEQDLASVLNHIHAAYQNAYKANNLYQKHLNKVNAELPDGRAKAAARDEDPLFRSIIKQAESLFNLQREIEAKIPNTAGPRAGDPVYQV